MGWFNHQLEKQNPPLFGENFTLPKKIPRLPVKWQHGNKSPVKPWRRARVGSGWWLVGEVGVWLSFGEFLETCLGNFAWIFFLLLFGGGCLEDCWFIFNCLFWCGGGWFEIHCGCLFCFQEEYYQKQFRVKMLVAVFALYPPNHSNKSGGAAFLNGRMNSEQFQRVGVTWNLLVGN